MPIHTHTITLPIEILGHIFVLSAQISGTVHIPFQKRQIPAQVIFSHVSTTWRQIALDTRELWTDVSIENPLKNEEVYQAWFSRAGHRSIRLKLNLTDGISQCETTDTFWKVVKRIHVRYLKLKIHMGQLLQLVESPGRTLHDLEQLDLDVNLREDVEASTVPQFVSRTRSLSFYDPIRPAYDLFPLIEGLAFPWAQLSRLRLIYTYVTLPECMDLLIRAPFLEECYLYITTDHSLGGEREHLKLPLIRTLTLALGELVVAVGDVIRHFEFPNLEQLTLIGISTWSHEIYDLLKSRCNLCHIQGLHILHYSGDPCAPCTRTILTDAPMLRCLDVPEFKIFDAETLRGISSGDVGYFLKNSTILRIESEVDAVLNMVEERQKTVAQKIERGYSWREPELASLKEITIKVFWDGMSTRRIEKWKCRQRYEERLVELERLGVRVEILWWGSGLACTHFEL